MVRFAYKLSIWWRNLLDATYHRWKLGFNRQDCWSLDVSIANYILPRLIYFRKVNNGYPDELGEAGWNVTLDKMIEAFRLISNKWENYPYSSDEEQAFIQEGLYCFYKYYRYLWW